jgi:dihydrofolate reductase
MGKVVVSQFVTIDGVMEDPGGAEKDRFDRGGWAFAYERGADGDKFKLDELMESGALLLGRVTWEGFAAAWPGRSDPDGFADKFNGMPKYVVSSTLTDPSWENSHVIAPDDLAGEIGRLRDEVDGTLLVAGSMQLCHALLDQGLVDELRLMVFPTVLGKGKRLFGETGAPRAMRLTDCRPVGGDGVLVAVYEPVPDAGQ